MKYEQGNADTDGRRGPADQRTLRLLGRFDLTGPGVVVPGAAAQRLLALLAVRGGSLDRWHAGQVLYPRGSEAQAASSLRAVVWRLQRSRAEFLRATATELRLAPGLAVDYWTAMPIAHRLLDGTVLLDPAGLRDALRANLREDLLPTWPEPWLVAERERFHQMRLHALEVLCAKLVACGWTGAAVDVGLAVVASDPLRESARRALIDAYLAEGNICEAVRQYQDFCWVLNAELGLKPTDALRRRLAAGANEHSPVPHPST